MLQFLGEVSTGPSFKPKQTTYLIQRSLKKSFTKLHWSRWSFFVCYVLTLHLSILEREELFQMEQGVQWYFFKNAFNHSPSNDMSFVKFGQTVFEIVMKIRLNVLCQETTGPYVQNSHCIRSKTNFILKYILLVCFDKRTKSIWSL